MNANQQPEQDLAKVAPETPTLDCKIVVYHARSSPNEIGIPARSDDYRASYLCVCRYVPSGDGRRHGRREP